jgi:nucleotide-binding universal stress UspA family protein
MTSVPSATAFLNLVAGYDGSPPASRALDAAVTLLHGRPGRIDVLYVVHLSGIAVEAPVVPAEMEPGFDQIEQELRDQAAGQLSDSGVSWEFERRVGGAIAEELTAYATAVQEADPAKFVTIVVGSSSSAIHRVAGSVAVGLSRHPSVPVLIVP